MRRPIDRPCLRNSCEWSLFVVVVVVMTVSCTNADSRLVSRTDSLNSWISTYMLVGTAKECQSVGQAGKDHKDLVEQVISELVAAVSAKEGISFPSGTIERLAAYTDVVTDFPCAVKEFEWRNQYFYNLGEEACPTHNGLLRECQEKGLLSFALP